MRCGNLKHRQQSGATACESLPPYLRHRQPPKSLATHQTTSISPASQVPAVPATPQAQPFRHGIIALWLRPPGRDSPPWRC